MRLIHDVRIWKKQQFMKYVNIQINKNSAQIRFGKQIYIYIHIFSFKPREVFSHPKTLIWGWALVNVTHSLLLPPWELAASAPIRDHRADDLMTCVYMWLGGWFWCQHTEVKWFQLNFGQCMFRNKQDRKEVVESQLWSEEENSPYLHSYICPYSFHPQKIFPTSEVFRFSLKTPEMRLRCSMRRLACHCVGCLQNDK